MKGLIVFVIFVAATIFGISLYLQPNDFAKCQDTPDEKCQAADAIIVVSGGDTRARAAAGIEHYKNGWANKIVFSGAAQDKSGPSNAEAMRQQALAAGVLPESILIDEEAVNTQQNAEKTQSILTEQGFKKVILVTSGYHQRRASLEFEKQAGTAVQVLSWPLSKDKDWGAFWWVTPRGWWLAVGELVRIGAFYGGLEG